MAAGVFSLKRIFPCDHFGKYDAERPDVRALVEKFADRLLRRHVADRSGCAYALRASSGGRQASQAEVHNLCDTVLRQDDIGRLDVAVHHRAGVRGRQALAHLDRDIYRLRQTKRGAANPYRHGFAGVVRHHDESTVAVLLDAVDDADVGMVKRRSKARFAQEPVLFFRTGDGLLGKEFERYGAFEFRVERAINHAHTPGTGQSEDLVFANDISRRQSGGRVRHRASPTGELPQTRSNFVAPKSVPSARRHDDTLPHSERAEKCPEGE